MSKKASQSSRRVFIVEDHPVFREGLVRMLGSEKDLEICGEAGDYEQGLSGIKNTNRTLFLWTLSCPRQKRFGFDKKRSGQSKLPVKMLVCLDV